MTDWLEWADFVLGLVGTVGVLILVRQWLVDHHSRQPYRVSFPLGRLLPRWGREVQLEFHILNRRSRPARFSAWLAVPADTGGKGRGFFGLSNVSVTGVPLLIRYPACRFEIPAGEELGFLVCAEVLPSQPWPPAVSFQLIDDRPGWTQFQFDREFPTSPVPDMIEVHSGPPPAPPPVVAAPPEKGSP
jgi:hypothetical protein